MQGGGSGRGGGARQEGADILIASRQKRLKITAIIPAEIQEETNI